MEELVADYYNTTLTSPRVPTKYSRCWDPLKEVTNQQNEELSV